MTLDGKMFGLEIEGELLLNLLAIKGDVSSSKYLQATFEGIRIPKTELGSPVRPIPFLIAQTPLEIEEMVLRFKWKGKKMRAGIFRGKLFDSQSRTEFPPYGFPLYGDINDRKISYAIENEDINRENLIMFLKYPASDPRSKYTFKRSKEGIYTGSYFIPKTEHTHEEKGVAVMKSISQSS